MQKQAETFGMDTKIYFSFFLTGGRISSEPGSHDLKVTFEMKENVFIRHKLNVCC